MTQTQFVYFYIPATGNGDELRLSIMSVRKHFVGDPSFVVIGDKPSWYDGPHIPLKRFTEIRDQKERMPFRDTQHKIFTCASHPEIDEEFVWIMDDNWMLKPTTLQDMKIPRYDPWYKTKTSAPWHKLIRDTFTVLRQHGKPNLQYGTHLPHVFEKSKLLDMFQVYGFPKNLYLFEILYGNTYRNQSEAVPYGGRFNDIEYPKFLARHLRPLKLKEMELVNANFMNCPAVCWNKNLKYWLDRKLN